MSSPIKKPSPLELLASHGASRVVPIRWESGKLHLLDQRILPFEEIWLSYSTADQVAHAITDMVVRGAPAIGITAAFGMVLAAKSLENRDAQTFREEWLSQAEMMIKARPTAINLLWAVDRMKKLVLSAEAALSTTRITARLEEEALAIWQEDVQANLAMGEYGQALFPEEGGILTHCNAGALATGGYGTALGVIRAAVANGKKIRVFADETRPWLQGARLTAYELIKDNIPVTIIVDSASGLLMRRGEIQAVVVGADRIAANGDVANKIGTYNVAELARANNIPFYVAAPTSTMDPHTSSGEKIPVEERSPDEITTFADKRIAAPGAMAYNPVFDITPNHLVSAIITERGVLTPPYGPAISSCLS